MKRFIVVTFLFLGFLFYELSGGANFEPRGVRPPKPERVATSTPKPEPLATASVDPVIAPRKPVRTVPTPDPDAQRATQTETDSEAIEAAVRLARARVNLADGLTLLNTSNPAQGLTLTSLSDGVSGLRSAPVEDAPATEATLPVSETFEPLPDIREVKATRVNMRQGPGTNFPVIARLTLGHEVEVLSESGTGWLRLRTRPEGTMGWISASLVSKKPQ